VTERAIDTGNDNSSRISTQDNFLEGEENMPAIDLQSLAADLRVVIGRLSRRLRSEQNHHELTLSQISALLSLEYHGALSPTSLSHIERIKPPSMTKILACLLEKGLVRKRPHESDGRQFLIEITDQGQELLNSDRRYKEAWLEKAMSALSVKERKDISQAVNALGRLIKL
jgi:DNA-binding MarR family transcriptional regulator